MHERSLSRRHASARYRASSRRFSSTARSIALSAAMTHHQDMGGMAPGSIPTNATEIFQEGLRIPPLKLRDAGEYNETLVAIIRQNVRIPDTVMGDLNAQIAACNVGARRIAELADELGDNHTAGDFRRSARPLGDDDAGSAAERSRTALTATSIIIDNDGIDLDKHIRFEVAVTVKDGTIPRRLHRHRRRRCAGRSTACRRARWRRPALRCARVTDPAIPTNAGCFRPDHARIAEGHRSSIRRARAGQLAHRDHQAHHRLHPRRARRMCCRIACRRDSSGEMLAVMFGGRHRDGAALRDRRADRRRQRRGRHIRRRRRHRDRRHQLHELARGGAWRWKRRSAFTASRCGEIRRRRDASRRPRHHQGVRGARRRSSFTLSRRAALLRAAGIARRRRRRARRMPSSARADGAQGGHPVEDDDDAEAWRPRHHRNRGRRGQRPARGARSQALAIDLVDGKVSAGQARAQYGRQ